MTDSVERAPILVLGIGNILLQDEGVGVRAAEAFQLSGPPLGVEVVDGGTGGADLLDIISDRRKLIVIDAMQADFEPGTVLRLMVDDLVGAARHRISLHEIGLLDTLEMARHLAAAPQEVVIFGVQPAQIRPGDYLQPAVAAAIPRIVELVRAECA